MTLSKEELTANELLISNNHLCQNTVYDENGVWENESVSISYFGSIDCCNQFMVYAVSFTIFGLAISIFCNH